MQRSQARSSRRAGGTAQVRAGAGLAKSDSLLPGRQPAAAEPAKSRVILPGESCDPLSIRRLLERSQIVWTPPLEVGIHWIDDQHRELFALHRELIRSLGDEPSAAEFQRGFVRMFASVREHFAEEERFMAERDCADLVTHASQHQRLLRDAEDFAFSIVKVFGPAECIAVVRYLRLWLLRHITEADARLGRCAGEGNDRALEF